MTSGTQKSPDKAIRWIAVISLAASVIAFAIVSAVHGIQREYRYEVIIITIAWIELIFISLLISRYFKQKHN